MGRRRVDPGHLVVLGIDALQSCEEDDDVEGKALPDAEEEQRRQRHLRVVQPLHRRDAEPRKYIVHDSVPAVEYPAEHDAHRDDRRNVRQEVDGLEQVSQTYLRVQDDCQEQGEDDGHGRDDQHVEERVPQGLVEDVVSGDELVIVPPQALHRSCGEIVPLIETHDEHPDKRVEREDSYHDQRRSYVQIS